MRSAVQAGYGVTFISRSAVEPELAAGTLTAARVEGLDAKREISLVRASGRTADASRGRVRRVRARARSRRDRPLGSRASSPRSPASARSSSRAPRWRQRARVRRAVGGSPVPSDRGSGGCRHDRRRRRRQRDRHRQGRVRGDRACRSSRCRRRTRARSGRRSSACATPTGRCAAAAAARELHAIVYEPELHARPAARRDGRHGAERARALRRGAVRSRTDAGERSACAGRRRADRQSGCRGS